MKKALLVIDVQNIYTHSESELYCTDHKQTVKKINGLIEAFQKKGYPIVYIKHIHKADGSDTGRMFDFAGPIEDFNFKEGSEEVEFDKDLYLVSNATIIFKNRYSSFVGTSLEKILKENNIDTVTICGFMTNFCCESTARDAHDRDYYVEFISDATGAPESETMNETKIREVVSELLSGGISKIFDYETYSLEF
ncbi:MULTISPECIES: cysteine hydrolase family protein [unclassified Chryseobacterium]|uniref:cysteine hydrolase family protein n=1 Tax=unclassified Chryseobacterium TaxID=2593645 RepID=UPI0013FD4D57|nr:MULTISPECIES: isochorismatase family cysteine hydrolase [unclassified Chryseobacterium]